MRKIISPMFETVRVRHAHDVASTPRESMSIVLKSFPSSRVQSLGTVKRLVRDRENFDPRGVVPYVFLSSEWLGADECWYEAANKITSDKEKLQEMMDNYPNG